MPAPLPRAFTDPELAGLYDALNPQGPSDDFYLSLMRSAPSVLDAGCGTGVLLRRARESGHTGPLYGLDPAPAMLELARHHDGVTWLLGDLASAAHRVPACALVVMTGHAFQSLVTDAELRAALGAVRTVLARGGRFAFETRNPGVRPWRRWTPEHAVEVTDRHGATVRVEQRVRTPVTRDVVDLVETYHPEGRPPRTSRARLRFHTAPALDAHLHAAGLTVTARYGDWDGSPLGPDSPEIITLATRAEGAGPGLR